MAPGPGAADIALEVPISSGFMGVLERALCAASRIGLMQESRRSDEQVLAAVRRGDVAVVRGALSAGWPPDGSGEDPWTPLRWAAEHAQLAMVELLVGAGAEIDFQDPKDGWTALHHAVDSDVDGAAQSNAKSIDWSLTKKFLALGADHLLRTFKGETAGDIAAEYGQVASDSFSRLVA